MRQASDEIVRTRSPGGLCDLLLARPGATVGDVLCDAGREQHGLLEHDRELVAQLGESVVAQVHAVEQDGAGGRVVKARQQTHQRCLAGPRRSGDRHARARRRFERDVVQDRMRGVVGERHVAEGHGAPRSLDGAGVRPLGDVAGLVQERERPLDAGEIRLETARLLADRLQRLIQLAEVTHDHQELAETQDAGADVTHADEQDDSRAERGGESQERAITTLQQREPQARGHALARAVHEPLRLPCLLPEGLDDAERAECLLNDGERRALELLYLAGLFAHTRPVRARQEGERRANAEGHERQVAVEPGGHRDHRAERDRGRQGWHGAVDQKGLDRLGVLLNAIDGVGGAARVVVGQGQPLDLVDEASAETEDQPLAEVGAQQRAAETLELPQCRDDEEHADRPEQDGCGRAGHRLWQERGQERRQRARPEDRINHNLQGHRVQERDEAPEQAEHQQPNE